jgi:hypothetical protein
MRRLRDLELNTLSEALLHLYSSEAYADPPARMFGALRRCFFFDLEWQCTDLYNYCFRSGGLNRQPAFMTLDQPPRLGIALNRSQRVFLRRNARF